jgi:hypothetical protein
MKSYPLKQSLLSFLLIVGTFFQLSAQSAGIVRGFIYDGNSGEPVLFATVYLKGTTFGATSNSDGFFNMPKVPVGDYEVICTFVGYDTATTSITVKDNSIVNVSLEISEIQIKINEVNVNARQQEAATEVKVSTITVKPETIKRLPSIGGDADIAQYLSVLPGVISTGDQGGQLYIRGGSPVQTKFLLDGMTIYNPFHSLGLFSVYETEILRSVDVYTGGFNATYGNRISAVLDVTTRDGNKKRFSSLVGINPFYSKAILEGPLFKEKENGTSASFLMSGKYSYIDKTSKGLYPYVNDGEGIPFSFFDFYGKMSFKMSSGSKVNLFGFRFGDNATLNQTSQFGWNSFGTGANFVLVPGNSNLFITSNISYSQYEVTLTEPDGLPRRSFIGGFDLGMGFTYYVKEGEVNYGFEVSGFKTEYEFYNVLGIKVEENQNTTDLAAYFNYRKVIGNLVIEPGFRFQYYGSLSSISPEPRLGMKYNISKKVRIKLATGIYSQNLISTKSDRDVVNLFTGFLSGPEENLINTDGERASSKLQRAGHVVAGIEYDPFTNFTINVEPYYKRFFQLININRNKLFPSDPNFMIETGRAYGIDVSLRYNNGGLFVWTAYSWAHVNRFDGQQTYPPHFDRRHNLNSVVSYQFGKNRSWEAGLRWNLGTGFPFTRTQGFYEDVNLSNQGVGVDYTGTNGTLGIIYEDDINAGRLPTYHRLDLSIKKTFGIGQYGKLEIVGSVTNAYNRENIFYFDRVRYDRVNQLPILPSLGITLGY